MSALAHEVLAALWHQLGLPRAALQRAQLVGKEPVLPSSFAVGTAAQVAVAAAALAATEVGRVRNGTLQDVRIDMRDAAIECCGAFSVDGKAPTVWDPIAGLYPCRRERPSGHPEPAAWVRIHTNFAHHRDAVLGLLGLPLGSATGRDEVAAALLKVEAAWLEEAAAAAGAAVAALRRFDQWEQHPQHAALAALPLIELTRIGDAPPLPWPELGAGGRPLQGLRVLDLTRVLAGPVAGRTLAAYGADVMLVNSPELPNIAAIADTSRGKRSALADLHVAADRAEFAAALGGAHVMLQSYRPGGMAALGFSAAQVARLRPGIVYGSLSAYGRQGPWADRRGFDSLVQTATGFNDAEASAAGNATPRALPMQILDMASGFLMAYGLQAALLRQRKDGGSWHVQLSLARTGMWLRSLGRVDDGFAAPPVDLRAAMETSESGFGRLAACRHAAQFSGTRAAYERPSVPPGTDRLAWD
ncbi:MAG: CoA transferase [Pseudomonadota bacterium]|nr:CoA transferase [Pseudomonadota bacterium]